MIPRYMMCLIKGTTYFAIMYKNLLNGNFLDLEKRKRTEVVRSLKQVALRPIECSEK